MMVATTLGVLSSSIGLYCCCAPWWKLPGTDTSDILTPFLILLSAGKTVLPAQSQPEASEKHGEAAASSLSRDATHMDGQ